MAENWLLTVGDTSEMARNCQLWSLYYLYMYAGIVYVHVHITMHVFYDDRFSPLHPNFWTWNNNVWDK